MGRSLYNQVEIRTMLLRSRIRKIMFRYSAENNPIITPESKNMTLLTPNPIEVLAVGCTISSCRDGTKE